MDEISLSRQEMGIYCKYLTGLDADEQCLLLFYRAIQHEETVLNDAEIKKLQFIIRNPGSMGLIDSALGMFNPEHALRKRMVIAFAILETSPVYYEFFKPKTFSRGHIFTLFAKGIQEAFQAIAGSIILILI